MIIKNGLLIIIFSFIFDFRENFLKIAYFVVGSPQFFS